MTSTEIEAGILPEAPPRAVAAERVVSRYTMWAAGAGLIPVPGLDVTAVAGVQVKMVYELAKLYDVAFTEARAKSLVGALASSVVSYNLAMGTHGTFGVLVKAVPVVGPLLSLSVMPALSSATTYAVGKVFIQHFEAGGTLLSFEPERMREHFRREFEAARGTQEPAPAAPAAPVETVKAEPAKPSKSSPAT